MRKGFLFLVIAIVMTGEGKAEDVPCPAPGTLGNGEWMTLAQTAAVNTGVTGLLSPAQSTTKDFLNKLTAAFAVPMSGDGSRPVSLAWNIPIPRLGGGKDDDREHLNVQAVFAKPEMSGELKARIGDNAEEVTRINDSLSEFDDLTIRAAFGPSMHGLGRSMAPHHDVYKKMLDQQMEGAPADEKAICDFAKRFSILLNNQPQFYGEVTYHALKDVAGPDEHSVRLTYEHGFNNLTKFYKRNPSCAEAEPPADCASRLITAADEAKTKSEDRVAVSLEYRRWSALNIVIPDVPELSTPRARSLVYSMAYGRNHMMMPKGRLDLEVNYEDTTARTSDSEAVRDRFVASVTYTYEINGMMAMPLTLTYANHGAYLGDVGRKLNAHFGLSFKMRP